MAAAPTDRRVICMVALGTLLAAAASRAKPLEIKPCKRVLLQVEDPQVRSEAEDIGRLVCRKAQRLAKLFGLPPGQLVLVRIAADVRSFHRQTGKSYHTLAVYRARGFADMILTQPVDLLQPLKRFAAVLTHELVHMMIHRSAGACPRWLDEGLAQWYEGRWPRGRDPNAGAPRSAEAIEAMERRWHQAAVPVVQRRADYRASLAAVALLVERVGEQALLAGLRGLRRERKPLELDIEGRSLAMWLFRDRPPVSERPGPRRRAVRPAAGRGDRGLSEMPLEQMLERAREKRAGQR